MDNKVNALKQDLPSGIKNKKGGFIIAVTYIEDVAQLCMIIGYYDLNGFNDLFSENTINQTNI